MTGYESVTVLFTAVTGGLVAWFSKMWFCDRMAWPFEDMRDRHPPDAAWLCAGKEATR
jgi:hypothetical protein